MIKEIFENLTNILDTEILMYTKLRDLYAKKRELLVKNDVLKLSDIDAKIIEKYEEIKKTDSKRVDATKMIGDDVMCMSQLADIAQDKCPEYVNKIKDQRAKLENLTRNLSVLNLANMELINHGMVMTDKKLNIIVNACSPKSNSYNSKGLESSEEMMSTIIQDI